MLAVIFDFDDTLVPDSTTLLLERFGIDADAFWKQEAWKLVEQGFDPPLAYLKLILDRVGKDQAFGELRNEDLRAFGASLDDVLFPGVPQLFDDLRQVVVPFEDVAIEFYIVSGGLEEVILGSSVVASNFRGVYGCQFGEDENGVIRYIKRCITFTEKTRYLFEINKGIRPEDSKTRPQLVNEDIAATDRRIPFENMVYVGDGLTDIPCFSLVKKNGGTPFAVFDPTKSDKAKVAFQQFLRSGRTFSTHRPRFSADDDLGIFLRAAVSTRASELVVRRAGA